MIIFVWVWESPLDGLCQDSSRDTSINSQKVLKKMKTLGIFKSIFWPPPLLILKILHPWTIGYDNLSLKVVFFFNNFWVSLLK